MIENKYRFRKFSIAVWCITLAIFFIGLMACISSDYVYRIFSSTTQQTYTLIFVLSMAFFIIIGINLYFSEIISIAFREDAIVISNTKSGKSTVLPKENIVHYSLNITKKGMLDILRIRLTDKSVYFWLGAVHFDQEYKIDLIQKENLLLQLKQELHEKIRKTSADSLILFMTANFPLIILFLASAVFIAGFIYIINL